MGGELTGADQLVDREGLDNRAVTLDIPQFYKGNRIVGGSQIDADDKTTFRSQEYPLSGLTLAMGVLPIQPP